MKRLITKSFSIKVSQFVKKLKEREPISLSNQYQSMEELSAAIDQAETELQSGGGYSTSEAKAKVREWLLFDQHSRLTVLTGRRRIGEKSLAGIPNCLSVYWA